MIELGVAPPSFPNRPTAAHSTFATEWVGQGQGGAAPSVAGQMARSACVHAPPKRIHQVRMHAGAG